MRSLGGFVLLAGIGVGLFVYLPAPVDRDTSLEHVSRLAAAASRPQTAPSRSRLLAFAPEIPLPVLAQRRKPALEKPVRVAAVRPAPRIAPRDGALSGWQTVVSTSSAPVKHGQASLTPSDPDSRYKLVVELQRNLKRLGCYWGRIDGSWGPGSKYAMKYFTDRVNAALPTEQPDYVLLTLLKAHNGKTCGGCPNGQVLSSGGRCTAKPLIVQSRPDHNTQQASADPLPWKSAGQPVFKPIANSVISTEPLPGRMAIGGPKALPPVDQPYVARTNQSQGVATANLTPNATPQAQALGEPPPAATHVKRERRRSHKRSRRRHGPGTPRYNLMLSLGGVY